MSFINRFIEEFNYVVVDAAIYATPFFNSPFFLSISGAFAGAFGAYLIADRTKDRKDSQEEIRHLNSSSAVAFDICNTVLSLKKQHVKDLVEGYNKQKANILIALQSPNPQFSFDANLQTIELPFIPIELLQNLVFEKTQIGGRPQFLLTALIRAIDSLEEVLERRIRLIDIFKNGNFTQAEFITRYFGLPYVGGHVDNEYGSAIEAIDSYLKDAIFFSQKLGDDLFEYGQSRSGVFHKKFGGKKIILHKPDWHKAHKEELIPNDDEYADWLSMFKAAPKNNIWIIVYSLQQSFLNFFTQRT